MKTIPQNISCKIPIRVALFLHTDWYLISKSEFMIMDLVIGQIGMKKYWNFEVRDIFEGKKRSQHIIGCRKRRSETNEKRINKSPSLRDCLIFE